MNVEQVREALKATYYGPNWADKVDRMPEHQLYAVWNRVKDKPRKPYIRPGVNIRRTNNESI